MWKYLLLIAAVELDITDQKSFAEKEEISKSNHDKDWRHETVRFLHQIAQHRIMVEHFIPVRIPNGLKANPRQSLAELLKLHRQVHGEDDDDDFGEAPRNPSADVDPLEQRNVPVLEANDSEDNRPLFDVNGLRRQPKFFFGTHAPSVP